MIKKITLLSLLLLGSGLIYGQTKINEHKKPESVTERNSKLESNQVENSSSVNQSSSDDVNNKDKELKDNSEFETKSTNKHQSLPPDFPKYIDTGEKLKDIENYRKRRDEWIKNNPEKYKSFLDPGSTTNKRPTPRKVSSK